MILRHLKLPSGRIKKKGIVFTLDVFIGLFIALIIITVGLYYLIQSSNERLAQLQLIRTSSDIMAILDYKGLLSSENSTLMEYDMNYMLPNNMGMQITIQTQTFATGTSDVPPEKGLIVAGQRVVYINGVYGKATYLAWFK